MYKYLLYIIFTVLVETDCPDKDKYVYYEPLYKDGGIVKGYRSCGVYHCKEVNDTIKLEFDTITDLLNFKETLPIEYKEIIIDSLKVQ